MAYNVFVSYSTKDIWAADYLNKTLSAIGIDVFIAEYSIHPGEEMHPKMLEAIRDCNIFIVLWSKNSHESDYVRQEIGAAKITNTHIIPILLDANTKLPAFLDGIKYEKADDNFEEKIEKVKQIIVDKANRKNNREGLFVLAAIGGLLLLIANSE